MDSNQHSLQATGDNEKMNKLIRSKYKDVMVKAGEDIFYVDRLKLALKSVYFEKLLVQKWSKKNRDPITIPFDSSTFSTVLDVIYTDCSWPSVLTADNFASVLEAKDFFHMNQSDYNHSKFISDYLKKTSKSDVKVFQLLNFVTQNGNLPKLLIKIHKYLHENLEYFQDREELLSLPLDQFVEMITWDDQPGSRKTNCDENQIKEICIKWICHDVQNRFQHLVKIASACFTKIKSMFRMNESSIKMKLSDVNEQNKETVRRYFLRFFTWGSGIVIDDGVAERFDDSPSDSDEENDKTNAKNDDTDSESDDADESPRKKKKKVDDPNDKLKEYLKNGNFYDITVKVGRKSYKLHRSVLQSNSNYFDQLFSTEYAEAVAHCEGLPDLPNKTKKYVIEGIDEATFDLLIDHIYSGMQNWIDISPENMARVFRAADILGISKLLQDFNSSYYYLDDKLDSERLLEMLDITRNKIHYKDRYNRYLKRYISESWPNVDLMDDFLSISWDTLEGWLQSRQDFNFDDPEQMLDFCSKWIWHDVKNRYQFIARAAIAIKDYSVPDYEDYKMKTPSNLAGYSEQVIRDEIREILGSTPLLPADTMSKANRKLDDGPVFITSTPGSGGMIIEIRDANFNPIKTLSFSLFVSNKVLSATIVKDNVFMCGYNVRFMAYNMPSNKFILLHPDPRIRTECTLLNCRDEVYSCHEDGSILKYSFLFNRWMRFSKPESDKDEVRFTSDGEKLYRMYQSSSSGSRGNLKPTYIVEVYDFKQNKWSPLPDLPSPIPSGGRFGTSNSDLPSAYGLTIINECKPAIIFKEIVLWLDGKGKSQTWRSIPLPQHQNWREPKPPNFNLFAVAQGENNQLFCVSANKLHHYANSDQRWVLKKNMPVPNIIFFQMGHAPYHYVVAVNRPMVSTT